MIVLVERKDAGGALAVDGATWLVDAAGSGLPAADDVRATPTCRWSSAQGAADDAAAMIRALAALSRSRSRPRRPQPHRRPPLGPALLHRPPGAIARTRRDPGAAPARRPRARPRHARTRPVGHRPARAEASSCAQRRVTPKRSRTRRTERDAHDHRRHDRPPEARPARPPDPGYGARHRLDARCAAMIARLTPRAEGKALKGRSHAIEVIGFGYGPSVGHQDRRRHRSRTGRAVHPQRRRHGRARRRR